MKNSIKIFLFLLSAIYTQNSYGQSNEIKNDRNLIVYGDGFIFGLTEPVGWKGDIANAREFYSNIIFYKNDEVLENASAIIQVSSFGKQDEKTNKDLQYDINSYQQQYKNLKLQKFSAIHKEYKCYSKMMYVENEFYQYTVYVNPGPEYSSGLSVAMNIQKRAATEIELSAFQQIIASLAMLSK